MRVRARSAKVGARSMFAVIFFTVRPCGTCGPATTSGTRMSLSKAVSLPGSRRCSPMWSPLSEVKIT
jgi:hypothetical protein